MMTFKDLDELRCRCGESELEEIEGLPKCLRCKTCRGWFALPLSLMTDLKRVREEFGEPRL